MSLPRTLLGALIARLSAPDFAAALPGGAWKDVLPRGCLLPAATVANGGGTNEYDNEGYDDIGIIDVNIYAEDADAAAEAAEAVGGLSEPDVPHRRGRVLWFRAATSSSDADPDAGPGGGDVFRETVTFRYQVQVT